jgi:hypothetical protein
MTDAYTRPYGDAASSNFPKMGDMPLVGSIVNVSGDRSPYTHPKARDAGSISADDGGGVRQAVRPVGAMATGENAGPVFAPQTTIAFPNSPEASQTGRGLRTVKSAIGNRDFWDSRTSQSGQVID